MNAEICALDAVGAVAAAAAAAADVDRNARFPHESVDSMREARLLSASLPSSLGGMSASVVELATIARALGGACSSAGMVFAMHHTQALTLRFHGSAGDVAELTREVARKESLLASATTEITTGGDVRSSTCAVEVSGDGSMVRLEKNAPVISYGEYADYICVTARRAADAPPSDQVLLVCPAEDVKLERTSDWDTLGFRGTCSPGYRLLAETAAVNVIPTEYAMISAHTMLPASHTLWSAVWLGIADAAMKKARYQLRALSRRGGDVVEAAAGRFADLLVIHQQFESAVVAEVNRYDEFLRGGSAEPTLGFAIAMNNLKIMASVRVVEVVAGALSICGINGYREDHASSMGRLLRDSYGPQLMVSNDRIRANNAKLVQAYRN